MDSPNIFMLNCYNQQYALRRAYYHRNELMVGGRLSWLDHVDIKRHFKWLPPGITLHIECADLKTIPPVLPDCKKVVIRMRHQNLNEDIPAALLRMPNLESLHVSLNVIFTRIPASLQVKHLEASCCEAPYWLADSDSSRDVYVRGYRGWQNPLKCLKNLLLQALLHQQTPFGRWLTQGLYDPRLFLLIRGFLL